MVPPDFLIIGAMKCGTSTLQAQLARQPGIFMTTPKEPNFFSDDDVHAQGLGWYGALFDGAGPDDLTGEASTHYTKLPTHPATLERLTQVLEAPRLIYLVRNPVARAVSHYIHDWTMGTMSGDIDAAFDAHPELIDYGRYGYQLAPWVARFGAEAILVSSLEAMTRDPQRVLSRVGAHIGHPGTLIWQEDQAQVNASAERIRQLPFHGLLVDNPVATWARRTLVPQGVRDRIRKGRQMTDRPTPSAALTARLEQVFSEDHAQLMALFPGRSDVGAAIAQDLTLAYPFLKS